VIVDGREVSLAGLAEPVIDTVAMGERSEMAEHRPIRTVKTTIGTGLIAGGAGYGLYRGMSGDFRGEDAVIVAGLIAAGAPAQSQQPGGRAAMGDDAAQRLPSAAGTAARPA
jgi:hypothetical protein